MKDQAINSDFYNGAVGMERGDAQYFANNVYFHSRSYLSLKQENIVPVDKHRYMNRYDAEEAIWHDIFNEKLVKKNRVCLKDFTLLEWIPQAPGLYHTSEARRSRENAFFMHRLSVDDKTVLFDPYGKGQMIKGGIGCMRIDDRIIQGERTFFLCATSSGVAHRGIVIALNEDLYDQISENIKRGITCNIYGEIRTLGNDSSVYICKEIPKLCLYAHYIDDIKPVSGVLDVTASVSFEGTVEGKKGIFYTYSHFDPKSLSSLKECVEWIERNYVNKMYKGTILTDFDEERRHFSGIVFPVNYLMEPSPSPEHISRLNELLGKLGIKGENNYNIRIGYVKGDIIGLGVQGTGHVIGKDINVSDSSPKRNT